MRKFLVCREDMLGSRLKSNGDYLPKVVEARDPYDALEKVLASWSSNYRPMNRPFLVVPLEEATVIMFTPLVDYEVRTIPYEG